MDNKLLINGLTLSRILFGILFSYGVLYLDLNKIFLLIIFILTALSDYSDGKLARKFNLDSQNGAVLDVVSDFIFIMISTIALVIADLIPFWFLFIIILKIVEFKLTSNSSDEFYYEKFGHLVALMFYALPIFVVIFDFSKSIILVLCIFVSICAIISSILRVKTIRG